ncbi:MAG: hypothetical protein PHT21_03065 [Lachnospiraceae bacterium]|nr:hypothetical protein [Lachnospiraceae bacterium]
MHKILIKIKSILKKEQLWEICFYTVVFLSILAFAILQPLGDPPDEINRYKVAQYICLHGTLPHGADPEIAIVGYGASYAFQPIFPYMVMGYLMRFLFLFVTSNFYILSYAARFVNVIAGVLMAVFVRKISKEIFPSKLSAWVMTLLIVFLPQNLFLHSYINTDSFAALSASIIIYACLRGLRDQWSVKTSMLLAVGIILCALSYYNAYGVIIAAIMIFCYSFFRLGSFRPANIEQRKIFFQKTLFISIIVLVGAGWWFLRNALLYEGDFLGMAARSKCAIETAFPQFNPLTKATIQGSGESVLYLFRETDFKYYLFKSFIAYFGPMAIPTYEWIYNIYKFIFVFGLICLILPVKRVEYLVHLDQKTRGFFHISMLVDSIIPACLCVWYSYSWDYQPQGRYILPLLIPFMYFLTVGFTRFDSFLSERNMKLSLVTKGFQILLIVFLCISLFATILGVVIPYYLAMPNWFFEAIASFS